MSLLREKPDSEFFQNVPKVRDAMLSFKDNDAKSKLEYFGHIFVKHGVEKEFGLVMVHRHFDISKDEVLVETLNDEKTVSVTSPWIMKDTTVVAPNNEKLWVEHATKMKEYVVPQTWSFDKNGDLQPFEYLASDVPMRAPPQSFTAELHSELKHLGLERILGVRSVQNIFGRASWEITPDHARSSVVVFGSRPEGFTDDTLVPVFWYFDKNGKLYLGGGCQYLCGQCRFH